MPKRSFIVAVPDPTDRETGPEDAVRLAAQMHPLVARKVRYNGFSTKLTQYTAATRKVLSADEYAAALLRSERREAIKLQGAEAPFNVINTGDGGWIIWGNVYDAPGMAE